MEKLNCTDPFFQKGGSDGATSTGMCRPQGPKSTAWFYEFPSEAAAIDWLKSGKLEYGPGELVYLAGPVVILTTDAATAKQAAKLFTPYGA